MCILGPTEIQQINGATGGSQKIEKDLVGQNNHSKLFFQMKLKFG